MLQWRYPTKTRAEILPIAEARLYRLIQQELFGPELAALQNGEPLSSSSKIAKFGPYVDDSGVLRAEGRLSESELPYSAKHPVLLGKHYLTSLILERAHPKQMHGGVETVLASLRQEVLVIGVWRALRGIGSRCGVCKRYEAAAATQVTPPLPADRVSHVKPFGLTGIDYAGPLMVRKGDRVEKTWIALFVCGTTRAVHLETVDSLSTESFLLAYRRFVARRGIPIRIRSDNATTFKSASEKINVVWLFNPPAAPWHGGFFERLVGAVKAPLRKVLGKAMLGPRELDTVLAEVEAVVNSRPLTHVADTDDDLPLTPAMMINGVWQADEISAEQAAGLTAEQLNARQRYVATVGEHLKKRWQREYLTSLIAYHQSKSSSVKAGEVVLLVDESRKRQFWRLARVTEVYPGKDGVVRVVRVKVGQTSLLRPVQHLVPLEVSPTAGEVASSDDETSTDEAVEIPPPTSPPQPDPQPVAADNEVRTTRTGPRVRAPTRLDL